MRAVQERRNVDEQLAAVRAELAAADEQDLAELRARPAPLPRRVRRRRAEGDAGVRQARQN